jgi:hypothetical protein
VDNLVFIDRDDGEWQLAYSTKGNKTLNQVANWIDPERLSAVNPRGRFRRRYHRI